MQRVIQTIAISLTLMGLSLGCLGSNSVADNVLFGAAARPPEPSCSSAVTISTKEISLVEDGDVTAVYDEAKDNLLSETDANGGTSWGYRSFQTCIYPNTAFSGTIEIPLSSNGNLSGRFTAQLTYRDGGAVSEALPSKLTFTGDGSANRQCITYTRVDDAIRNAKEDPYVLDLGTMVEKDASNEDNLNGTYYGADACDISVSIDDDEGPGVRVSNISRIMEEPGVAPPNDATFSVELRTTPTAPVTITINDTYDSVNANNREGTTSPTTLIFSAANTPQTVTVTSVDDLEVDGLKSYIVAVNSTSSSDADYNGIDPRDVVVYNRDKSVPGYTYERFDATSGSTDTSGGTINGFATDEANNMGTTYSTFKIKLRSKPQANVTLNFTTTCGSKCTLLTSSLTFTPTDWNSYQTVQVQGAADGADAGNQDYNVTFTVSSSDLTYKNDVAKPIFKVRSCDNDFSHEIQPCNFSGSPLGTSGSRFSSAEPSGTNTIWLIAKTAPGADITVPLSSTDGTEGSVNATATINSSNYNKLMAGESNRVIMSHLDDTIVDGSQNWTVTTGTSSGGVSYNTTDIYATTTDNENYFYVNVSGSTQEGTATTATISVCLGANNPDEVVKVDVVCANPADECGTLSTAQLTFPTDSQVSLANASNSGCPNDAKKQQFTVTGLDDSWSDGTQNFTINLTMVANGDSGYSGASNPSNPSVANADNEPAGKAIFVTNATFNGEMTAQGVQGADNLCNNNKVSGVPSGTYKALIFSNSGGEVNDRTTSSDWVIQPNLHYYICTGSGYSNCSDEHKQIFIADGSGLFTPTSMSRNFSSNGGDEFWTGANTNLTPATQSSTPAAQSGDPNYRHNCAGFTYQNAPVSPNPTYYGETWSNGSNSVTQNTNVACTTSKKLICVQQ